MVNLQRRGCSINFEVRVCEVVCTIPNQASLLHECLHVTRMEVAYVALPFTVVVDACT